MLLSKTSVRIVRKKVNCSRTGPSRYIPVSYPVGSMERPIHNHVDGTQEMLSVVKGIKQHLISHCSGHGIILKHNDLLRHVGLCGELWYETAVSDIVD